MWVESHVDLPRHPKLLRLCHRLKVAVPLAIGCLHLLWYWAMEYADETGALGDLEPEELALICQWEGDPRDLVNALLEAGFLDRDEDGTLRVHNWRRYAGRLLADRERKRRARAQERPETAADEAQTVTSPSADESDVVRGTSADSPRTVRANHNRNHNRKNITVDLPSGDQRQAAAAAAACDGGPQWELWLAHCRALGLLPDAPDAIPPPFPSKRERTKQMAIAMQLVREGYTSDDVAGCTRWLAETRRVQTPDLARVRAEIAAWVMAGRPQPPPRASPSASARPSPNGSVKLAALLAVPDDIPPSEVLRREREMIAEKRRMAAEGAS